MKEYKLIYTDFMKLLDDDIIIFGRTPKIALKVFLKLTDKEDLVKSKCEKASFIIWTGKMRIGFDIK